MPIRLVSDLHLGLQHRYDSRTHGLLTQEAGPVSGEFLVVQLQPPPAVELDDGGAAVAVAGAG